MLSLISIILANQVMQPTSGQEMEKKIPLLNGKRFWATVKGYKHKEGWKIVPSSSTYCTVLGNIFYWWHSSLDNEVHDNVAYQQKEASEEGDKYIYISLSVFPSFFQCHLWFRINNLLWLLSEIHSKHLRLLLSSSTLTSI